MSTGIAAVSTQTRDQNVSCFQGVRNWVNNPTTVKILKVAAAIFGLTLGVALVAFPVVIPMSAVLSIGLIAGGYLSIIGSINLLINQVVDSSYSAVSSLLSRMRVGQITGSTLYTTFEDVRTRPEHYLELVTRNANAFPERVLLINAGEDRAVDVNGITREFVSKLIKYLVEPSRVGANPTIILNDTGFPMLQSEEGRQTYQRLGMLYSIIDQKNAHPQNKNILTGTLFHAGFFAILQKVARGDSREELRKEVARQKAAAEETQPDWLPLFLQPGDAQVLQNYATKYRTTVENVQQELLPTLEAGLDEVINASRCFYQGATPEFQAKIRENNPANLAREIQGEPITVAGILRALQCQSLPSNYQAWIREKIQNSDEAWRMRFVSTITGCRALSSTAYIRISARSANEEEGPFKINTCFSSISVPIGLEKEDFLRGLDGVLGDGYNYH